MKDKIILKPTDYDIDGEYTYSFQSLKDDVISLGNLTASQLVDECKKRWEIYSKFPIPSNYSKYRAAFNLAMELGLNVSLNADVAKVNSLTETKNNQIQPER